MGPPPIVTGISPKEGPPGTRVTIRGENFGFGPEDVIGLIICNSDCLLSAEWVSSNKIVARSGPSKSKGDVIVITKSGGTGSCTVQFRGYHETIGPLKESAVWVDETHLTGLGRHRTLLPSSYQQDDPLGLSVENTVKKYPEEELQELFPEANGELGSENFSPSWFLLQHHHSTSFDDLKAGLSFLKRRVEAQKEGQISFLKSHAGSVIEQMDSLVDLKRIVGDNKSKYGPDMTTPLETSILMAKAEADRLFEDVLERKDQADGTRNALGVMQRFRFLFHLPSALDKNIEKADYDLVINDYARARALFGNTEVQVFQRVLYEAEQRISTLREVLQEKLQIFPSSMDEQKKIIRNLVNLECPDDPAWFCIAGQFRYSCQVLFLCKDSYLAKEQEEQIRAGQAAKSKKPNQSLMVSATEAAENATPGRITFMEELNDRFVVLFPDLWKLGQAYFNEELFVKVGPSRREEFKKMTIDMVNIYSQLIRAAFISHTLDRQSPHRDQFGIWPPFNSSFSDPDGIGSWYVFCLRCVRACYAGLLTLDLPAEPLNAIRDLLHDLRVHCMRSLLMQAAENVTALVKQENWVVEFIESHGSITQLPHRFEMQVIDCLQLVKETVFQAEQRETNLTENASVLSDLNILVQKLLFSFPRNVERLTSPDQDHSEDSTRDSKLLLALSNCQYTIKHILPRLNEHWTKSGYPDLSAAVQAANDLFEKTDEKLMDAYSEEIVEPLIGIVEPSMYAGRFDWNKALSTDDVRPYAKEIIMNMIAVHAEVAHVCPSLVGRILERVVREVAAELGRLFSCVNKFSESGVLQAKADLAALSRACRHVNCRGPDRQKTTADPFAEAAAMVPTLNGQDNQEKLNKILSTFEQRMKFQLLCLEIR